MINDDTVIMNYSKYKLKDQYSSDITIAIQFFFIVLVVLLVGITILIIIMVTSMIMPGGDISSIEYISTAHASSISSSIATTTNAQVTSTVQILPAIITYCELPIVWFDKIINGTNHRDILRGTAGNDLIFGFAGNDIILGKNGDDCIIGGPGADFILGGAGDDILFGSQETTGFMEDVVQTLFLEIKDTTRYQVMMAMI